jgi:hypothetical protein
MRGHVLERVFRQALPHGTAGIAEVHDLSDDQIRRVEIDALKRYLRRTLGG